GGPKPPRPVRPAPAEHRPHDLPLPGLQPERLSRPLALVVPAEALNEFHDPVGSSLVPPVPVRFTGHLRPGRPALQVPRLPLDAEPLQLPDRPHFATTPPNRKSAASSFRPVGGFAATRRRSLGESPSAAPNRRMSSAARFRNATSGRGASSPVCVICVQPRRASSDRQCRQRA